MKCAFTFTAELKNVKFKKAFVEFLITHWTTEAAVSYIQGKEIYLSFDKCYKYSVSNLQVILNIINEYHCDHEEADTKFAFFLEKMKEPQNIVIRCADTDILVILLGNMSHFYELANIWLHFGTGNNTRYINVSAIYSELGKEICDALPAMHALTGCDFNPAFLRRGKIKPFQILCKFEKYQTAF